MSESGYFVLDIDTPWEELLDSEYIDILEQEAMVVHHCKSCRMEKVGLQDVPIDWFDKEIEKAEGVLKRTKHKLDRLVEFSRQRAFE
jgi:hypothetical protein